MVHKDFRRCRFTLEKCGLPKHNEHEPACRKLYLEANVYPCAYSYSPYSNATCKTFNETEEMVSSLSFSTLMISHTFNPYTYRETGSVQVSTRFEGQFEVTTDGQYYYRSPNLDKDKWS